MIKNCYCQILLFLLKLDIKRKICHNYIMKKGFTLTELLIAVVIIGILLAMVIPKITEMIDRSRETSTMANLGSLKTALATYYGDTEEWPRGNIDGNGADDALGPNDFARALVPNYIDKIPPALLKRGIPGNQSTMTYTNQTNDANQPASCTTHGEYCLGQLPPCPAHGTITNDGGWWYHVGSHILRINSQERDTVGVFYSDYE